MPLFIVTPGQKGGIVAQLISDFYEDKIPVFTGFLERREKKQIQIEDDNYMTVSTTKWTVHLPIFLKNCESKEKVKCRAIFYMHSKENF